MYKSTLLPYPMDIYISTLPSYGTQWISIYPPYCPTRMGLKINRTSCSVTPYGCLNQSYCPTPMGVYISTLLPYPLGCLNQSYWHTPMGVYISTLLPYLHGCLHVYINPTALPPWVSKSTLLSYPHGCLN
jgi:hypothetical protein